MLGCCPLPENFNTRPLPVWNMHLEGTQLGSLFMGKGEVSSSLLQKELNTIVYS